MENHRSPSTNPFDDSSSSCSDEEFHDCQQPTNRTTSFRQRAAPLDFNVTIIPEDEAPALKFDRLLFADKNEFFSPLESALLQAQHESLTTEGHDSNMVTESQRDLIISGPTGHGGGDFLQVGQRLNETPAKNELAGHFSGIGGSRRVRWKDPVLRHLSHIDHESALDFKLILLEDLGTASSWALLLLPYIAFIFCLLLESELILRIDGPLEAGFVCSNMTSPSAIPLIPAPRKPCLYQFELQENDSFLRFVEGRGGFVNTQFKALMTNGWFFDSGPISSVPPSSTFIRCDAAFNNMSTAAVAMVAKGTVVISTMVWQKESEILSSLNPDTEWIPVFTSTPTHLSLACHVASQTSNNVTESTSWNCTAPRIVEMLELLPGTRMLTGSDLRIIILFSYHKYLPPAWDELEYNFVYVENPGAEDLFGSVNVSNPVEIVNAIVKSSSYTVEHQSILSANVALAVRSVALMVSGVFLAFWFWAIIIRSLDPSCCLSERTDGENSKLLGRAHASMWWKSPWILFPERYYILLLLLALLMVQNPLLIAIEFFPQLYNDSLLRITADAILGVGVNTILFVYVCLFHGLRYHTAPVASRRNNHVRQVLNLRRAAKYVSEANTSDDATDESVSRYTAEYYDQCGDTDGSSSSSSLRLKHDPCGSNCADFLIPKLIILVLGIGSVLVTAFARYSASDDDVNLGPATLEGYEELYVVGSFVQFGTVMLWVILILQRALGTGKKLRNEPFLRTRPAQLAYRILLAQMVLGALALTVPFVTDLVHVVKKWTSSITTAGDTRSGASDISLQRTSELDLLLRILAGVAQRFPYTGTASSVGPGKILFATVCILSTAVIFLPPKPFNETESDIHKNSFEDFESSFRNSFGPEKVRQRKDKRVVVTLAKHTHTWRVFPLSIMRASGQTLMPTEKSFLISHDFEKVQTRREGRGMVSVGSYTSVFCVEIACWLNEASWQAYYSPVERASDNEWAPGQINLTNLGLILERVVYDETADVQAYIATNPCPRVDGDKDSIIVVSFRGSASASNIKTDFRSRQVPLVDEIIGDVGGAAFRIFPDRIDAHDESWNLPASKDIHILQQSHTSPISKLTGVKRRAKAVLASTPVGKGAFPCVHEGFQDVYLSLRKQLLEHFVSILQRQLATACARAEASERRNKYDDPVETVVLPKVYVTGHSMGGCLAQLFALDIASNCELALMKPEVHRSNDIPSFRSVSPSLSLEFSWSHDDAEESTAHMVLQPAVAVYTFGQPRLGNRNFARLYKLRVPHTFRIAVEADPVINLPIVAFCGGLYKHAGLEVVLDDACNGNTLVGPTVVETLFRFHKVRTDVSAHSLSRYRDCLESALEPDELEEYYRSHVDLSGSDYRTLSSAQHSVPSWMTNVRK